MQPPDSQGILPVYLAARRDGHPPGSHVPASIFLSYASEDRQPARSIGEALAGYGVEVWLDESELGGGDAWDQKIRKQIRECDYFMPIISARTEARHEGYFRREWRLAVERCMDMADDHLFLLPVVIDDTDQARARVPERFLSVQWLRVPEGRPTPALETLSRRILSGDTSPRAPAGGTRRAAAAGSRPAPHGSYPAFPREEPGQRVRFWAEVLGWLARCAWVSLQRLPRWLRIALYVWLGVLLLSRGCTRESHHRSDISSADDQKLKAIAEAYRGSANPADVSKLGAQIAGEIGREVSHAGSPEVLAIPFAAPGGDDPAARLADAAFAETYGRLSLSHRGEVALDESSAASGDPAAALARGRERHARYVIYGALRSLDGKPQLSVAIVRVADGSPVWSRAYGVDGADPTSIARQIDSKVPSSSSSDED